MNDEQIDAYLWDPNADVAPEVAALERVVAPCRFEALPLTVTPASPMPRPRAARNWAFGLAAALMGVGVLCLLRPPPEPDAVVQKQTPPALTPVAPPEPELEPEPEPEPEPKPEVEPAQPPASPTPLPRPQKKPKLDAKKHKSTAKAGSGEQKSSPTDLPEKLSAQDILDGVKQVKGGVRACGREHDIAEGTKVAVKFQIRGSTGDVDFATVLPSHGGVDPMHPAVPCIQKEARAATFRRFRAERQSFTYKFKM